MEELKKLLNINEFEGLNKEDFQEKFKDIANKLLNNYCITKGNKIYEFVEVECYLYSANHQDIITYPRGVRLGDWFLHPSGVDLCFGDENTERKYYDELIPISQKSSFGGILIRCMRTKISENEYRYFAGPWNCADELFDQFSAISNDNSGKEYPHITLKENKSSEEILWCARRIKLSNPTERCRTILKNIFHKKYDIENNDFKKIESDFEQYIDCDYRFFLPNIFENPTDERLKKYTNKPYVGYKNIIQ